MNLKFLKEYRKRTAKIISGQARTTLEEALAQHKRVNQPPAKSPTKEKPKP